MITHYANLDHIIYEATSWITLNFDAMTQEIAAVRETPYSESLLPVQIFGSGQQQATVVGVGIAVEKGFQPGGKALRESGVHLKSLAIVDGIKDGNIVLRPEND